MRDIIPFSSAPATAGQPSMSGWRLLSTDQQCDTLVEGSRGTAGDVSAGPVQACSFAAGAAATGVASSGDAGGSPGAALQGEEDWRLVPTAGVEGLRRWAADRARCRLHSERARPGCAEGTRKALAAAHRHTIVCLGCAAFVDLQAARAAARRAGSHSIGPTDGCYGCGPHRRVGRHAEGQRRMAAAVLTGSRVLVERPPTAMGRSPLWMVPRSEAALCADEALAALDW